MKKFWAGLASFAFAFGGCAYASTTTPFDDQSVFNAATTDQQSTGFSVTCQGACYQYVGTSYTVNNINFSSNDPNQGGGMNLNSASQTGFSVPTLSNVFEPNDTTDPDILTIKLPSAVTAFAVDFAESVNDSGITIGLGNGYSISPPTTAFQPQFEGFVSDTPFNTITITDTQPDGWFILDVTTAVAAVPEPSTWAMMLLGFFGIGAMTYRRRKGMMTA